MSTFFKNTELAVRYNISEATVRNWIKATKEGKHQLELIDRGGRTYVANSIRNIPLIEGLVEQNRKYRNTLAAKTITPDPKLFKIFSEAQIYDIIRNLELHHEIPRQYGYFGWGAKAVDDYIAQQMSVDAPSVVRRSIEMLAANYSYIDKRLANFKKVNVVDIGVGNAMPIKDLLSRLVAQGKLGRYIGLDFSEDMLSIAKRNLKGWFGSSFQFEGYQVDITHERFANIVAEDYLSPEQDVINLVLFLGATPMNFRAPADAFKTISESMNPYDLLIYTDSVRLAASPEWIRYTYKVEPSRLELLDRHKFVLDLLNIKDPLYVAEMGFDEAAKQGYSRARLKFALTLKFELEDGVRSVHFEKGEAITLWRCWRFIPRDLINLLESTGFYVLHTSQSEDHNYILTIAEVQKS